MKKERIYYFDVIDLIERYIDQVGITKACADIMIVLSNRLYDKLKIIGPALEKENNEPISSEGENHEKIS